MFNPPVISSTENYLSGAYLATRFNLTKQEYFVLSYLNEGLSVKAVAEKLDLSLHTVNGHMKSIYFKLNVKSRGQAQHKFNEYKTVVANDEKSDRAAELVIANDVKANRAAELVIANDEKADRAAELLIANDEKADRAAELLIANDEKADRAAELVIANDEKANRAAELKAALLGKDSANKKAYQTESKFLACLNALALTRDNETGNHILRTQHYVKSLALRLKEMGHYKKELSDEMIELLFKAAPLHDIGKVGIPDSILHKPGRLNDEEWQVMKTHVTIGRAILTSAEIAIHGGSGVVTIAIQIAGDHHEKWDGSGYPSGLKGEEIALAARIMALADFFDSLISKRVYKAAWSFEDVVSEIISQRGAHFDPLVVDAFMMERAGFLAIHSKYFIPAVKAPVSALPADELVLGKCVNA
jgi:response regulator RpfG family c-di-GMP phosphodiesterase